MVLAVIQKRFVPFCKPDIARYIHSVVNAAQKGHVGPGPLVAEAQKALTEMIGGGPALLTTSGTVALQLGTISLFGLPTHWAKPPTIVVPAYGVVAVPNAFASMGCRLIFVDVDKHGVMNADDVLHVLENEEADAVCYVHFSGLIWPQFWTILSACKKAGVYLIEDASCAIGHRQSVHNGRGETELQCAGSFGDVGVLSFSSPKVITTGQGGAIIFNTTNADYDLVRNYIDQGDTSRSGKPIFPGTNLRMSDLAAALLLAQLKDIDDLIARKMTVQRLLVEHLNTDRLLHGFSGPPLHNIIHVGDMEDRPAWLSQLDHAGVQARTQYGNLAALSAYTDQATKTYPTMFAQWWADTTIYLPFGMAMTPSEATYVGQEVAKLFQEQANRH